jgi:CDGSH-type Zn-finger protein
VLAVHERLRSVTVVDSSAPGITTRPNGPFLVSGELPLVQRSPIETEFGEPIAWSSPQPIPVPTPGASYALCRCGGSSNKPFCDSTHKTIGFDGSDGERADDRRDYSGTQLVVRDDRGLCTHAGFCGDRVTNVWKMVRNTADTAVRSRVVAMVERCPSGALTYAFEPGQADNEPALPQQVAVTPDGPLWVTGAVPVVGASGDELPRRNRMTLCRCGASRRKPLCDGTHKDIGFQHRL